MNDVPRPIKIAITAMGGQGGGVLSDWLVKVAEDNGYYAQATSVPGVAQRTGATVYYLEIFPREPAERAGKPPVMALMPVAGDVDVVVAGELVEAGRAMLRGFVTPDQTTLIASRHRDYAYAEKSAMADGRVNESRILEAGEEKAKRFVCFDMAAVAEETGSVISAVLLGAVAGAGVLPFERERFEQAIREGGVGVEASLRAFAAGFERASGALAGQAPETPPAQTDSAGRVTAQNPQIQRLLDRLYGEFPEACHELMVAGLRRVIDYQDVSYGREYLDRLASVRSVDVAEGGREQGYRLTATVARHLALWMSFEDTIRVADLKTRPRRFTRVHEEVRAEPEQLLYITEFMHPRVEEVCDTLPRALGAYVLGSERLKRLLQRVVGKPRKVQTAKLSGFLLLYTLAALRRWRRGTYRFAVEQANIDEWLGQIERLAPRDYELAVAFAECQGLVKGYGETHARGLGNYRRILGLIDEIAAREAPARLLRELREAALADEFGEQLAARLAERNLQRVA